MALGSPVDIELDKFGYAHILYHQTEPFDQVRYTYQDAAGWHSTPVTNTLSNCEDMALDSQDNPHLSCIANDHLVYAHLDSGGWHTQTIASLGVPWGYSSIAVDDFDYTHISYDNPNHGSLEYAFIGAGSPVTETVNAYGGAHLSLALSSVGQPFISYANPAGGLELAYRDNRRLAHPQSRSQGRLPGVAPRTHPLRLLKGTSLLPWTLPTSRISLTWNRTEPAACTISTLAQINGAMSWSMRIRAGVPAYSLRSSWMRPATRTSPITSKGIRTAT